MKRKKEKNKRRTSCGDKKVDPSPKRTDKIVRNRLKIKKPPFQRTRCFVMPRQTITASWKLDDGHADFRVVSFL